MDGWMGSVQRKRGPKGNDEKKKTRLDNEEYASGW